MRRSVLTPRVRKDDTSVSLFIYVQRAGLVQSMEFYSMDSRVPEVQVENILCMVHKNGEKCNL